MIAYATGGLWIKNALHTEQAKVSYSYDALLLLEVLIGQYWQLTAVKEIARFFSSLAFRSFPDHSS